LGACCAATPMEELCANKCGPVTDACGFDVDCGANCELPATCGPITPNVCDCVDASACAGRCGTITDMGGKKIDCPNCPGGRPCKDTVCQCDDIAACKGRCGPVLNACLQTIDCGDTCTAPEYCGGGGLGVCGCQDNGTNWCAGKCDTTVKN